MSPKAAYKVNAHVNAVLAFAPACPGDGNGDGVVNDKDVRFLSYSIFFGSVLMFRR